jgi:micrococcal nuclease
MKHPSDLHRRSGHRHRRGPGRSVRASGPGRVAAALLALALGGLAWSLMPDSILPMPTGTNPPHTPVHPVPVHPVRAEFGFCRGGGERDCVVDGDTFRIGGVKVRIADIDTPETHPARCRREAELGDAATRRLHALLNAGAVTLAPVDRDADRYGRKLRVVAVDGRNVGDMLVAEGLARPYAGGRRAGWCG